MKRYIELEQKEDKLGLPSFRYHSNLMVTGVFQGLHCGKHLLWIDAFKIY